MTGQLNDADRETLYTRFSEHKKIPLAERQKLAYEAARDYVKRYSAEQDGRLAEMRRFVKEYERVMGNFEVYQAFSAGNYAKTFELGRAALQKDPENFYVLAILAHAGYANHLRGDPKLTEEALGAANRALAIVESENITKTDPFASAAEARGFLNFAVGMFELSLAPEKAEAALVKAAKAESSYKENPITYDMLGIAILKGKYAQVSAEYNTKFGNKPPSPEQQAMLQQIIKLGNRAIDAYARAVALSSKPDQHESRARMMAKLVQLYKNFHEGSDNGLNELITGVLAKPLPE